MRHLLTSHGPKKRQAPSKWVILYDHFYDWPDIICPKSRENKYSLYSNSIYYVFLQKHKHLLEIIPTVDGISQFSIGTTSSIRVCFPFLCYQRVPHLHTQHFPIPDRSFRLILSSTWRMAAARRWERSSACAKAVLWVNRWDHPKKEHPGKTKCARCFLVTVAVVRGFVLMEMNSNGCFSGQNNLKRWFFGRQMVFQHKIWIAVLFLYSWMFLQNILEWRSFPKRVNRSFFAIRARV